MKFTCLLVFVSLFTYVCGICHYIKGEHVLTCHGFDITYFPSIISNEIKYNTQHVDILNTSINILPNFNDWSNLSTINIRYNKFLSCKAVFKLQKSYDVSTDCLKLNTSMKEFNYNELYSLLIIPLLFSIPPIMALKYYKRMPINDRSYEIPNNAEPV